MIILLRISEMRESVCVRERESGRKINRERERENHKVKRRRKPSCVCVKIGLI